MQKPFVVAIVAAAASVAACGAARSQAGPAIEQSFEVGAFNRIAVSGPYEVDVRTGANPSVTARGPERAIERMIIDVKGDTLRIRPEKRKGLQIGLSREDPVRVSVTVPSLAAADIAGSGDVSVDRIAGESFEGGIAGSGDLRLGSVEVQRLKMEIAGSGGIRAQGGRAADAAYEIAGSGDIDARNIIAQTAAVSIAGSGKVDANATDEASVDIAGSGDVRIRGGARCRVSKAGSGNVDCS